MESVCIVLKYQRYFSTIQYTISYSVVGLGDLRDFGAYVIGVGMEVLGYFNWHDHISLAAL